MDFGVSPIFSETSLGILALLLRMVMEPEYLCFSEVIVHPLLIISRSVRSLGHESKIENFNGAVNPQVSSSPKANSSKTPYFK